MEQTLRQREKLNKHYPVKEVDYHSAYIVCFCCIAGVILGAIGILLNHAWPYLVKAVSAALN